MVNVNITNLNDKIIEMSKELENYNNVYLNLFNSIKEAEEYWHDQKSIKFFDKIEKEKNATELLKEDLKERCNLYKYIYENYRKIGTNISFNPDSRDMVLTKINNIQGIIQSILDKIEIIDIEPTNKELKIIKTKLQKLKKEIKEVKVNLNNFYNNVSNIEQEIEVKTSKLDEIKVLDIASEENI